MADNTLHSTGFIIVLGIYLVATLLYCFRFIFNNKSFSIYGLRLTLIGFAFHLGFFAAHLLKQGYPFLLSSFETYQLMSGCIVLVFFFLSFFYRSLTLGVVLLPVSLIFYILSLTRIVTYHSPNHLLANPWAFIHLVCVFLAMAIFIVSFITGIIYLLKEDRIKHKRFGGMLERFPSLEMMDRIHYRALYIGFLLFTIGILTGGGWSKSIYGVYVSNNLKQILSFAAWVFFAIFINLRVSKGWIGHRGILLSTIGFVAILFLFSWVNI